METETRLDMIELGRGLLGAVLMTIITWGKFI